MQTWINSSYKLNNLKIECNKTLCNLKKEYGTMFKKEITTLKQEITTGITHMKKQIQENTKKIDQIQDQHKKINNFMS